MPEIYDVVIVGSGAGGGIYAKTLTEAGARVLVLDAGAHQMDHDIRHHQWPWELPRRNAFQPDEEYAVRLDVKHVSVGPNGQTTERTQTTVFDGSAHNNYYNDHFWAKRRDWKYTFPKDKPYRYVRVRALGGKTNCWDAGAARWGPREFKAYSYDGHDIDWPVDYAEMAPWYTKVEELIGVSGGPVSHSEHCPQGSWLPAVGQRCGEARLGAAAEKKLGLQSFMGPKAAITREHRGRPSCHFCGPCNTGCDSGSKFTSVGVLLPPAMATGRLTIQMNSIVHRVLMGADGRARGVAYIDRYTYKQGEAYGKIVVLAASAIETARLLLISGVANSSGQVGRNLVENITGSVQGRFDDFRNREVVNDDGWGGASLLIPPFVNVDEKSRSKKFIRRHGLTLHGGFSRSAESVTGYRFGESFKRDAKSWYGTGVSVAGQGEGIQSPNNFVDLDPEVKDAWGIPAVRVQLTYGDNEQKMTDDITEWGIKIIEAAGGKVTGWQASPSIPGGSIHEQGVCRMGDDPKKFVTNRWGQCHDVKNLIIGDGSLHPSCAIGDPTLTIMAMAMRNSGHLADLVKKREI